MSVRLGAFLCVGALVACSHQPAAAVRSPSQAQPPAPPPSELVTASAAQDNPASLPSDTRTSRSDSRSGAGSDDDPELLRRIRQSSMADGSL
jgi:hypothetical protein